MPMKRLWQRHLRGLKKKLTDYREEKTKDMEIEKLVLPGIDASERPIIIAGPCSAESREQVLGTAQELAKNGVKVFRAGIWKPRTKPGGFEGVGTVGLPWLKEVKQKTGMLLHRGYHVHASG